MKQAGLLLGLICSNFLIECFGDDGKCAAFIGGGCLTWSQWEDKCYKVTEQLPWDEAKQECIKMGGVLVVPQLDGETDFLLKLYNQGFWIGCNQHNNPGLMIILFKNVTPFVKRPFLGMQMHLENKLRVKHVCE